MRTFERRRTAALAVVLLAILAVVFVPSAGSARAKAHPVTTKPGMGPAHWFGPHGRYGSWGSRANVFRALSPLAVDNLVNTGGGPIMPTTNTYLIFWLPSGFHYSEAGGDTAYENQMIKYFQDVGGSQILNTTTQYCSGGTCPDGNSAYKAMTVDTTAFPHQSPTDATGSQTNPLVQSDLNTEVSNVITNKGWPLGLSTMYFVFLPNGVADCNHLTADASKRCNYTNPGYCAYHTYGWQNGSDTDANDYVWADIADLRSPTTTIPIGCNDSNVTGNESADTTLSAVEHEQMEAITDPKLNAWQDSTGGSGENGDKCNQNMGVANSDSTVANNYLGAGAADKFRIQREWSNAAGGGGCAASYSASTTSGVVPPAPTGGDVVKSVTESTIAGNTSDVVHYTVSFHNPSDQDDAYNIKVTDTLPAGLKSGGSSSVTLNLGNLAPHQTASASFTASPTGPLLDGTDLTDSAVFSFDDSTGEAQPTITRTAKTTVANAPPAFNAVADQTVDYHDPLSFGVTATDANAGDSLSISASGLPAGLTLTDNGDRTATVSGTDTAVPGDYTVTLSVDDHHHLSLTTTTMTIHVVREETSLQYTGQTTILVGPSGATLSGKLQEEPATGDTDSDGSLAGPPDAGRSVTLSINGQFCTGLTDALGNVSCTLTFAQLVGIGVGSRTIVATYLGDSKYTGSSASATAIIFAFPSRGAFTVGDGSSSGTVVWWNANWYALNSVSGGQAPPSDKGFANSVATLPTGGTQPTACTGTWTTSGGNSPPPASGVPTYMGVLVTSLVTKTGSTINGNFVHIVVVRVAPGYNTNPDGTGSGTVVAVYC
jgi:fimbrial isopeptide formation D2 family protein